MANPQWNPELFDNALAGANSAVSAELIAQNQIAWGYNVAVRGGKPRTRPSFKYRATLPAGLVQGVSYFSIQGGMGVAMIGGLLYRIRINPSTYAVEPVSLSFPNSPLIKQVWMQQTVESLVIQDFQSNPIIYDGSSATRSNPAQGGVPRGRMMAYGNGRLWVAINQKELVAGDIRTNQPGSELRFTETQYLSGGGSLYFSNGITGMSFIDTTGTTDYGALCVGSSFGMDSIRADITQRDLWATYPGFVTSVLGHSGIAGQWSISPVNQDIYWRDSLGGIRSLRSGLADESGPGNTPISREVQRLTDYDSKQLLPFCSAITFGNRLLMTSSPFLNDVGGVSWRSLISLDFAPVSSMQGKSFPAYDGEWSGLWITHLFQGSFNGKPRAFAITHNEDGSNSLWEIMDDRSGDIADLTQECQGEDTELVESPVRCFLESGRRAFGSANRRKRLERMDVFLSDISGPVEMTVYWRTDNNAKWNRWSEPVEVCAKISDGTSSDPHIWQLLRPQQRAQVKTFTIPNRTDDVSKYALQTGFEFQIRIEWVGRCRIYKSMLYASLLDDTPYARRDLLDSSCVQQDSQGNSITYRIPICDRPTWYSAAITVNCPEGEYGPPVMVPAGHSVSYISQEYADGMALAYGESQLVCVEPLIVPLECSVRDANYTLCGFNEFGTPSVPPRRYRRRAAIGNQVLNKLAGSADCGLAGTGCNQTLTTDAVSTYDETCSVSTTGSAVNDDSDCGGSIITDTGTTASDFSPICFQPSFFLCGSVDTKTFRSQSCAGGCFTEVTPDRVFSCTGSIQSTLSMEDTEADAIARAFVGVPWGDWNLNDGCDPQVCCLAFEEARTSGYGAAIQQGRFRLTTAIPFNELRTIYIRVYRRPYGSSDPFVLYSTLEYTAQGDVSDSWTVIDNIPNVAGYESYVNTAEILPYQG